MIKSFLPVFLFSLTFILNAPNALSQNADTLTPVKKDHSPRKATLRSVIIPGWGQAYNKKYWKIPIIYGGGITLGLFYKYNHDQYIRWRNEFRANPFDDASRELRDQYREWRDWNIVLMAALYTLNIVDANVDAHLKEFDINDDLALTVKPYLCQNYFNQPVTGISLNLKFKK